MYAKHYPLLGIAQIFCRRGAEPNEETHFYAQFLTTRALPPYELLDGRYFSTHTNTEYGYPVHDTRIGACNRGRRTTELRTNESRVRSVGTDAQFAVCRVWQVHTRFLCAPRAFELLPLSTSLIASHIFAVLVAELRSAGPSEGAHSVFASFSLLAGFTSIFRSKLKKSLKDELLQSRTTCWSPASTIRSPRVSSSGLSPARVSSAGISSTGISSAAVSSAAAVR